MSFERFTADRLARTLQSAAPRGLKSRDSVAPSVWAGVAVVAALAAAAVVNDRLAKRAERNNPPEGKFVEVDGVRLHYLEQGNGPTLVLLHGNGTGSADFATSGLIGAAARRFRVIAFDRPGFGHTDRPRSTIWTPAAQARLIHRALQAIGATPAVVLGHSWGASVAVALAEAYPETVGALVLASGYYFPTARADVLTLSGPAVPVLGDILRYTLAPLLSRLTWSMAMKKLFGPAEVPAKFAAFPKEMAFRPSQLRASAAESALMIPDAAAAAGSYASLKMPVAIIAGEDDRMIDIDRQSARLHKAIPHSTLHRVAGVGHMVHQSATDRVMAAIDEAARASEPNRRNRAA